jgi:O-acetyl-ADP-ribose deacetylase (regulator of RNase III)
LYIKRKETHEKTVRGAKQMPLIITKNDITQMNTDAIVNAANAQLMNGGGVSGAIFAAAGVEELTQATSEIGGVPTGEAAITPGFHLQARYIIHAVGPIWRGGYDEEAEKLRSAYVHSLELARANNLTSISFPLLSAGIYGYPKEEAMDIALSVFQEFLLEHDMTIYLVLFDYDKARLGEKRTQALTAYVDEHYAQEMYVDEAAEILGEAQFQAASIQNDF